MKQYTETYRVKITPETRRQLNELRHKYHIVPAAFIRQAIERHITAEMPSLVNKKQAFFFPF